MRARNAGFSLIEIMAAMAIFGIVAVMAQQALLLALNTDERVTERRNDIAALQRAMTQLARDLENAAPRPVGDDPAVMLEDNALTITRGGTPNPAGLLRSGFQRVRYSVTGDGLERVVWRVLDPAPGQEPLRATLLPGATDIRFRVWGDGGWQGDWPVAEAGLPGGFEAVVTTGSFGVIRRVVSLQ